MKKIGRYEIVEELGRGAMGVVYKASDPTIGRLVAIKLLSLSPRAEAGLPGAKDIFLREARAAGRLSHPGIVTVHDALEDPVTQNCYIVMEFVPGQTLDKMLFSGPPLSTEKALDITRQMAEAIDYAHRHQIIHRDLKPANILLTEEGRVKITDFGIAKLITGGDAQGTLAIMGTPSYMSPEQVKGGEVNAASDVFSLGILLYLMLTGEKPFVGDTAAVMFKIVYQDPTPPSQHKSELGPAYDYLLLRALAKDRTQRYASAREFLDDLDDVQNGRPPRSQSKTPMSELRAGDLTMMVPKPKVPAQEAAPAVAPKNNRLVWAGLGGAALVLLLVAGILAFRHPSAAPPESAFPAETAAPPGPPTMKRSGPKPSPAVTAPAVSAVQFHCEYQIEEATLRVSTDGRVLLREVLKGRKQGKLLGLKRSYLGTFSRLLKIPSSAKKLTVHVESEDGSVDLTKSISATPPAGNSPTLHVVVKPKQMVLRW